MRGHQGLALQVVVFLLAASSSACTSAPGRFGDAGFSHAKLSYQVAYDRPGVRRFVGPDWFVDNYVGGASSKNRAKVGSGYETVLDLDTDGNGEVDRRQTVYTYDLLLLHRKREARLWVRTLPIPTALRHRELRLLGRAYVEAVADAGYVAVQLDGAVTIDARRYATRVLETASYKVSGREAFGITFEVANVDQLQLERSSRERRVRVVLVRTNKEWSHSLRDVHVSFPALMIVGYSNIPEDFERDSRALDQLIAAIEFTPGGPTSIPTAWTPIEPTPAASAEPPTETTEDPAEAPGN